MIDKIDLIKKVATNSNFPWRVRHNAAFTIFDSIKSHPAMKGFTWNLGIGYEEDTINLVEALRSYCPTTKENGVFGYVMFAVALPDNLFKIIDTNFVDPDFDLGEFHEHFNDWVAKLDANRNVVNGRIYNFKGYYTTFKKGGFRFHGGNIKRVRIPKNG